MRGSLQKLLSLCSGLLISFTLNTAHADLQSNSDDSSDDSSNVSATVMGAFLVGAGLVVIGIAATNATADDDVEEMARIDLFLKRYHAMIVQDLVLAKGPVLSSLMGDLGLNQAEQTRVMQLLEGSHEQTEMLEALALVSAPQKRLRFAKSFRRLMVRAVGAERLRSAEVKFSRRNKAKTPRGEAASAAG